LFKKILQSGVYVLVSNVMRLVSKFLVGIVSARILGPTNFGFYNLIDLVSKYGPLSNMGVSSGISREIPLNLGMGKEEYVEELNDAGFTGLLSTTSFIAALFIVYSFIFLKGLALFAVVMASAGVVFNAVYEYDIMYLYAHSRFRIASAVMGFFSLALFLLTLVLVFFFNIWGQFVSICAVPLAAILFTYIKKYHHFSFRINIPAYLHVIKIGLPLIVIGIAYTFLITIDRILITRFYNITMLGYYGLAIMLFVFSQQIPDAISQVIYPRLNLLFGQSKRVDALDNIAIIPSVLLSSAMPLMIGLLIYVLPFVVTRFLPAYVSGIPAAELIILPVTVIGVNILSTLFKIKILLSILAISIAVKVASAYLFYTMGMGLEGIAIASTLGILTYSVSVTIISLVYLKKSLRFILQYLLFYVLLPLAITVLFFLYINGFVGSVLVFLLPAAYYAIIVRRLARHNFNPAFLIEDVR